MTLRRTARATNPRATNASAENGAGWTTRRGIPRSRGVAGTAFAAAVVVLVTGAIIYPGFKTTEVELNDGGVWVVSKSKNAMGRLNYPSRVLDGAVTPASTTFDILQNAGDVFVDDETGSTLNQVSPANMRLGGDKKKGSAPHRGCCHASVGWRGEQRARYRSLEGSNWGRHTIEGLVTL